MGYNGRPRVYQKVEEFADAIKNYFDVIELENRESLAETGKYRRVPNIASLCVHMGINKDTFYEYARRNDYSGQPFTHAARMAATYLEGFKLEGAALGLVREIITIFDLKNNHGYADKMDVNTSNLPEHITPEEIKRQIQARQKESQE